VLAWSLRFESDLLIIGTFLAFACTLLLLLYLGRRTGWQWRRGSRARRLAEIVSSVVPWLKAGRHLPRWGNLIAWVSVSAYCIGVAVTASEVSTDVALLAIGLAGLLLLALSRLVPTSLIGALVHGAVFVTMAMSVYLDHIEPIKTRGFTALKWAIFPILLIAVVLRLRLWRERRFEVTPLDLLVVFLALVLPNLPGLQGAPSNIGLSVAKLILLMYAAELLLRHSDRTRSWLWASSCVALLLVGVRAFWPAAG
jgi:UDP-GlcNAc:undecaprenyl-phosphate GlcNAc-1-phosphate transferase